MQIEQIHLWEHDMSALFYYEGLLLIPSAKVKVVFL